MPIYKAMYRGYNSYNYVYLDADVGKCSKNILPQMVVRNGNLPWYNPYFHPRKFHRNINALPCSGKKLSKTDSKFAHENASLEDDPSFPFGCRPVFGRGGFLGSLFFLCSVTAGWALKLQRHNLRCALERNLQIAWLPTHMLHVWYIYLHLPLKSTKCR